MITALLLALAARLSWAARGMMALLLAASVMIDASTPVLAQDGHDITGVWRTPVDGGSTVRITSCGSDICAAVLSSPRLRDNPDQRDVRNPDHAHRSRPLRGLRILRARPAGPGRWDNGWIYNPEDGRTYRGSLRLLPDGRLQLTGCVVRPLCRSQTWTR